jgi:hypothetical protein
MDVNIFTLTGGPVVARIEVPETVPLSLVEEMPDFAGNCIGRYSNATSTANNSMIRSAKRSKSVDGVEVRVRGQIEV